nr:hypothetical protein [Tanacetum cinerariifolium]
MASLMFLGSVRLTLDWTNIEVPVSEGSLITTTARIRETYKNVSQDIRNQLNAEAEAVQLILTGIDNDINSTVDAYLNACEMWKAIERLKQGESIKVQDLETNLYWEFGKFTSHDGESLESYYSRGKAIVNSPQLIYDQEPSMVAEDDEMSKDKEIDKLMALISLSFKKIYKPNSSNTSRANQDNSPRINRSARYENQKNGNIAGARETVGSSVVQKSEQADWRDDADDDELEDQELEAHYMYMAQLKEVTPNAADSGRIFDDEPLQKVSHDDHYNVFAMENVQPEQSKSVHDTYPIEQDAQNTELDEVTNRQCDYLKLLEKCEGLETELSKSKMISKSFESVKKHVINLELELQQCKENIKIEMFFKVNKTKDFCKEREQYFKIQDLKAQLQDKGIVISELKKLIEKLKGKSVDTKFEKSSVIRQPNAFKSQRPSVLGKPTTFSNSFVRKDFSKATSVSQTHVSNDFSKPVTAQTLPKNNKSILKNTDAVFLDHNC